MSRKLLLISFFILSVLSLAPAFADESDIFNSFVKPNVLFILDNSNSMDEDFLGKAAGSYSTNSKSWIGRNDLTNIVNQFSSSLRLGLMSFKLDGVSSNTLSNSQYFASFNPQSYCAPRPGVDPQKNADGTNSPCLNYCLNGDATDVSVDNSDYKACNNICTYNNSKFDAQKALIEMGTVVTSDIWRKQYCPMVYPKVDVLTLPSTLSNPNSTPINLYYRYASPCYGCGASAYWYSSGYKLDSQVDKAGNPIENSSLGPNYATAYTTHTGTSDSSGYDIDQYGRPLPFTPTDSDLAANYHNFGQLAPAQYVGDAWYVNSSPGNGYLHVPIADTDAGQATLLLGKLGNVQSTGVPTPYLNSHDAYMLSCVNGNACPYVVNAGLTPTAGVFHSAYNYFNGQNDYLDSTANTSPIQYSCQQNFVVLVTDGLPSVDQYGNSGKDTDLIDDVTNQISTLQNMSYSNAKTGLTNTKGVLTYILGTGSEATNTTMLNAMAYAGGTGSAYYAGDAASLQAALSSITSDIISKVYSFTTTSVASSRITDENYLYETSFQPVNYDPFWQGHLVKYNINSDGSIGSQVWDAGTTLQSMSSASRNIYTYKSGSLVSFDTSHITTNDLGVSTSTLRDQIVGYVRGDSSYNFENWKLGDIFHSNIVTVGTPSIYYNDTRDKNNAFAAFRTANPRSSANLKRIILGGANDGQFHAFIAGGTGANGGKENWSFVAPNLMPKLQYLAHTTKQSSAPHQYLADGPVVVADAWLGSGSDTAKAVSDWHTLAILSVGKNDTTAYPKSYWSASSSCDSGLSPTYVATTSGTTLATPYYCGYYAFDYTNTLSPSFKWVLNPSSTTAPYLGEPWGKMAVGKVLISGKEKWVGFVGDGYNTANCTGNGTCDTRGKGFMVIDLSNGTVLWSYNRSNNSANNPPMNYSFAGSPAIIDADSDGFIDTVYIGDMGNNMWRFKLCTASQGNTCGTGNWSGSVFYSSSAGDTGPVYTTPTVTRDLSGNIWVYWGTGDKVSPTSTIAYDYLYAAKDDLQTKFTQGSLSDISSASATYSASSSLDGWCIKLAKGEKVLSDPVVFGGALYFSTYKPSTTGDLCSASGVGTVYAVNYISGAAITSLDNAGRVLSTGSGLATAPLVSVAPPPTGSGTDGSNNGLKQQTADLYLTYSGGPGANAQLYHQGTIPNSSTRNRILYWHDQRVK